jgi:hypothetical protein
MLIWAPGEAFIPPERISNVSIKDVISTFFGILCQGHSGEDPLELESSPDPKRLTLQTNETVSGTKQCSGSGSFWASRIRIRNYLYGYGSGSFRQLAKKSRKTLINCFVMS